MVMTIPDDVAQLPGAGQAADFGGAFEHGHLLPALSEPLGERQAKHAAAHDSPTTLLCRRGGRHDATITEVGASSMTSPRLISYAAPHLSHSTDACSGGAAGDHLEIG